MDDYAQTCAPDFDMKRTSGRGDLQIAPTHPKNATTQSGNPFWRNYDE